jgi:hypothetical protein
VSCPYECDPPCNAIDRTTRNHFVYWLFDTEGTCLYVGCTTRPAQRWKAHCVNRKQMVAETATRRMAGPYTRNVARRIEREQQDLLSPKYDRRLVGIEKAVISRREWRGFRKSLRDQKRAEAAS